VTKKPRDPLVTTERVTPVKMRKIRERLGLSQPEMARLLLLLGTSARQTVGRAENRKNKYGVPGPVQLVMLMLRDGARPPGVTLPCDRADEVAICTLCDRRAEDPEVRSCTHADCPMAKQEAA
jgi:transcriptional regulator with XRE-family HTH domain